MFGKEINFKHVNTSQACKRITKAMNPPTDRRLKHLKERADRIAAGSGKTSRTPDAVAPPTYKARAAHDDGEIVPSTAAVAASVRNAAGYVANAGMGRTNRRTRRSQ